MILSVIGFIVLLLADPSNLNQKGYVPFKYQYGVLFGFGAVLAMAFLTYTHRYVEAVNFFMLQMFYNLFVAACLLFWVAVLWADSRHPFQHKGGWETFGLLVLGYVFNIGYLIVFHYTRDKLKPNTEKILVYVGVFYCIIFDMAFFNVFPTLMQLLGTLLIVGTDIALIAYNIHVLNETERREKQRKVEAAE